MKVNGALFLGGLLLVSGCAGHEQASDSPGANAGGRRTAAAPIHSVLPNTVLQTHDGRTVRFYDDLVKDKVIIVNFTYTSCNGACPAITANLVKLQDILGDRLGRDIFILSISLDPKEDTPEVLRRHRAEVGARPGWTFLTGDFDEIQRLRRRLGSYDPDPVKDADRSQHSGMLVYGNDAIDRWAAMPGLAQPEFIAKSVMRLAGGH